MTTRFFAANNITEADAASLQKVHIDPATDLIDGDVCLVGSATSLTSYVLDADSSLAESSPDVLIPFGEIGDKRWIKHPSSGTHNLLDGLQGGTTDEYYHLLEAEYEELSNWPDNVTLGSNGVTTLPQLVLTPSDAAIEAVEGGIFYNNGDKSVYVCTDV